jgi:hypothetical protein
MARSRPDPELLRKVAAATGWCAALVIVFATLSPIGARPHIAGFGADLERFLAFFVTAGALAFAYPRRRGWILLAVIGVAVGLEVAQSFAPTRHGRAPDAVVKVLGGLVGVLFAAFAIKLRMPGAEAPGSVPARAAERITRWPRSR